MTLRQFAGGAAAQTLVAPVTSVALTATISDNSGWPTGSVGPFSVVVDRGTPTEEKWLCSAQAANTITIQTRGYDSTAAYAHAFGAVIEHCATSIDFAEANAHTSATSGVHGVTSQVAAVSDVQTFTNKTLTQPVIGDFTSANHDHSTTVAGGAVAQPSGSRIHTGTFSGSFGATTFVSFAHGASFTPVNACATISATSAGGNWDASVYSVGATNITVAWHAQGTATGATLTSVTINFTVFA